MLHQRERISKVEYRFFENDDDFPASNSLKYKFFT